jgi:outer membrane autotransporter protein
VRLLSLLVASTLAGQVAHAAPSCPETPTAYSVSTTLTSQVYLRCANESLTVTSTGSINALNPISASSLLSTNDIRIDGTVEHAYIGLSVLHSSVDEVVIGSTAHLTRVSPPPMTEGWIRSIDLTASQLRRFENSGQVQAEGVGLFVQNTEITGELLNTSTGVIAPASGSELESAVRLSENTRVEKLINHGTLSGTSYGILMTGENGAEITSGLVNTGTISGGTSGIRINGSVGNHIAGGLLNEGVIEGGDIGIRIDGSYDESDEPPPHGITGGIINRGTIAGEYLSVYAPDPQSLDRIDIEGTKARLVGDVYAPYTDLNIRTGSVFATEAAYQVNNFNVEAGARVDISGTSSTDENRNGVSVNGVFDNRGTVVISPNAVGSIHGHYQQASGARLELGVASMDTHATLTASSISLASGAGLHVVVAPQAELTIGGRLSNVVTASELRLEGGVSSIKVTDNSVKYKFALQARSTPPAPIPALPTLPPLTPPVTLNTPSAVVSMPVESTSPPELYEFGSLDLLVMQDDAPFVNSLGAGGAPVRSLASMLDQLGSSGVPAGLEPLVNQLRELPADQLEQNLTQLVPTLHAAGQQATLGAIRAVTTQIQGRLESVRSGKSAGNSLTERFAWVRAFGSTADQDNQGSVTGFRSRSHGLVVGADALVNPDWRAGLAFTYARSALDSVGSLAASQLDVNTYQLAHYGSYALDARTDINYQLDVGLNQNQGKRFINLTSQQADSDYDSVNLHGGVGVSRQWQLGEASTVSPGVRVDYSRIRTQAYTETGAGNLNLNVGSDRQEELVLAAELRGVHALSANTRLDGFVSAGYNFSDRSATSTSAFVGGGTTFTSAGLKSAPWLYRAGFGLLHSLGNLEYTARLDLEHRDSGLLSQTVSLRMRWAF